jgi:hypothetical protein
MGSDSGLYELVARISERAKKIEIGFGGYILDHGLMRKLSEGGHWIDQWFSAREM